MPTGAGGDEFTMAEVASHRGASSCWIVLRGEVYDFTEFAAHHPGGAESMRDYHGRDAGEIFDVFGHSRFAHELMRAKLLVFDAAACACVSSVREIARRGPAPLGGRSAAARPRAHSWSPAQISIATLVACGAVYRACCQP